MANEAYGVLLDVGVWGLTVDTHTVFPFQNVVNKVLDGKPGASKLKYILEKCYHVNVKVFR